MALAVPLAQGAIGAEERLPDGVGFVLGKRDAVGGGGVADEALGGLAVEQTEI